MFATGEVHLCHHLCLVAICTQDGSDKPASAATTAKSAAKKMTILNVNKQQKIITEYGSLATPTQM